MMNVRSIAFTPAEYLEGLSTMKALLLAFAILVCAPSLYAADPVSVYVFTATNTEGFVDGDSKGRIDSVADLKQALLKRKFVIADTAESADISVEVTARGMLETGDLKTETYRLPYSWKTDSETTKEKDLLLIVKLSAGTYEKELRSDEGVGYRMKATDIAKQVERWTKQNAATLAAR